MDKMSGWLEAAKKFVREVRGELRKVIWPDRKQTITLTSVVLVASALVGGIIWVFDLLVGQLMGLILK